MTGDARYGPIKRMQGGSVNLQDIFVSNMAHFFDKLIPPISSDYYLYIRRILSDVRLDPKKCF